MIVIMLKKLQRRWSSLLEAKDVHLFVAVTMNLRVMASSIDISLGSLVLSLRRKGPNWTLVSIFKQSQGKSSVLMPPIQS